MRGALLTSFWTLLSRILGFVRDAYMASVFGMSAGQGAFNLAWTFPNLFRRLFGEGAVAAAVQPALARAETEEGEQAAQQLYSGFVSVMFRVLLTITVVGELVLWVWRSQLVDQPEHFETRRTLAFASLLLPYLIPICLCALAAAPQQLRRHFLMPALAPVVLNVVWIGGLWFTVSYTYDYEVGWLWVLPWWVLFGGLMQWGIQRIGVRKVGWGRLPKAQRGDPRLKEAMRTFAPTLMGLAALQVAMAVDQVLIRSLVGPDANNYSHYANRMLHLPLALVGIAAMTGAMPMFSRLAAQKRLAEMSTALRRGCESTLMLMCAAGVGLAVVAHPALTLLFEHGETTPDKILRLTPALHAYLWVLPLAGLSGMLIRAHQSLGSYRLPAWAAVLVIPINLGLDVLWLPHHGVPAAGWATALAMTVQVLILYTTLPRVGLQRPLRLLVLPSLLLPAAAAGTAAWLSVQHGPNPYSIFGLTIAIAAGIAAGGLAAWLFRRQDFRDLLAAVRR